MNTGRVMVTGASGLLGQAVVERVGREFPVLALSHLKTAPGLVPVDLTKAADVERLRADAWEAVIHCAAHRSPDFCEAHREVAFALNTEVPARLARLAFERGARMIHISTDYVFPGTNPPYGETDSCQPVNVYGETKVAAEREVAAIYPGACILRIGALYGVPSERVSSPMLEEGIEAVLGGKPNEQDHVLKRYPLFVEDVAEVIRFLLGRREVGGAVQAGTQVGVTRYEWALLIGRVLGVKPDHIRPAAFDATRKATRPPDARLSVDRLRALGAPIPRDCDAVLPEVLGRCQPWIGRLRKEVVHPALT